MLRFSLSLCRKIIFFFFFCFGIFMENVLSTSTSAVFAMNELNWMDVFADKVLCISSEFFPVFFFAVVLQRSFSFNFIFFLYWNTRIKTSTTTIVSSYSINNVNNNNNHNHNTVTHSIHMYKHIIIYWELSEQGDLEPEQLFGWFSHIEFSSECIFQSIF